MAISQHGRFAAQNRMFESIEPAEEVSDLSARYLDSENRTDFGNSYRIIATSKKQYIMPFQIQQVEIVLQYALHSQKGKFTIRSREHIRMGICNFDAFLYFKKQLATT
jgi:hypothetical protein